MVIEVKAAIRTRVGIEKVVLIVPSVQPERLETHAVQEVVRDVRPDVDFVEHIFRTFFELQLLKEVAEDAVVKSVDQLCVALLVRNQQSGQF